MVTLQPDDPEQAFPQTVKFEPGGTHVMAMNLADTIAAGGQANVTVTFVGGDEVTFPAEVRAAGDER